MVRPRNGRNGRARRALCALALLLTAAHTTVAQAGVGTLSASPALLPPGGTVGVHWDDIVAPDSRVRLILYSVNRRSLVGYWLAAEGVPSGSAFFPLRDNLEAGPYEIRLYDARGGSLPLAVSNRFTVDRVFPALTGSPIRARPGNPTSVTWGNLPAAPYWVGLYRVGAPDVDVLAWQATSGHVFGTVAFPLPANLSSGFYEYRLFSQDRRTLLATSNQIRVDPQSASLLVGPVQVAAGDMLTAVWSGTRAPTSAVRLILYSVDRRSLVGYWHAAQGATAGSTLFKLRDRLEPGVYELQIFAPGQDFPLATSNRFTVDPIF